MALHLAVQHGTLLKSAATEAQLVGVLDRPQIARLIAPTARAWLLQVIAAAEHVDIVGNVTACRDPTDDKFLELADSGFADCIVTGDNDLLELHPFRGIAIVAPAAFVRDVRR